MKPFKAGYIILLMISIWFCLYPPMVYGESEGSLWKDNQSLSFLFTDYKASRVGDIVRIRVIEKSKGDKQATTKAEKGSSVSASISALFGLSDKNLSKAQIGTDMNEKSDSTGFTSRSSTLSAFITAKVIDVLPNGNLVIKGTREVMVNNEKQILSISGIIRPQDIGPDNTILSTYIADAKITYTGKGVIGDKQRVGWFIRLLDIIWPF